VGGGFGDNIHKTDVYSSKETTPIKISKKQHNKERERGRGESGMCSLGGGGKGSILKVSMKRRNSGRGGKRVIKEKECAPRGG